MLKQRTARRTYGMMAVEQRYPGMSIEAVLAHLYTQTGSISGVSAVLGIPRTTVHRWMHELGVNITPLKAAS